MCERFSAARHFGGRMIGMRPALAALILVALIHPQNVQAQRLPAASTIRRVGGLDVLTLHRTRTSDGKRPQFLSVTLLPNRGRDVFQVSADIPGRGETQLIESTSLEEAARRMDDPKVSPWGYVGSGMGGAFLIPWSSRITALSRPPGTDTSSRCTPTPTESTPFTACSTRRRWRPENRNDRQRTDRHGRAACRRFRRAVAFGNRSAVYGQSRC
jgi:hypothetical protein